jgi:fatty acid desaturase
MKKIRWVIFLAAIVLLAAICNYNFYQKHFNLFILGLLLLSIVLVVLFWFTFKWQHHEREDPPLKDKKA